MFRKAALSDLDAVSAIYAAIHDREEAGLSTIGWVRSIYPTRATAEASIRAGDMFVMEEEGRVVAAAKINQKQEESYARAAWTQNAADSEVLDGEYLFGAVCNSTSIGGLMKLDKTRVVLNDGKVTGIGTHAELIESNTEYQEIYNSQVERKEA